MILDIVVGLVLILFGTGIAERAWHDGITNLFILGGCVTLLGIVSWFRAGRAWHRRDKKRRAQEKEWEERMVVRPARRVQDLKTPPRE